jgi:hypothetical protein
MTSILLKPIPITEDNLDVVIDAEWITAGGGLPGRLGRPRGGLRLIAEADLM